MAKPLSILLLCDERPGSANTIRDHINAFRRHSRHDVRTFNPCDMKRSLALDLSQFDVAVLHYSLIVADDRYVSADFREKLKRYNGLKVQFIQDEYRWVDRTTAASRDIGIDILFTASPEPAAGRLYDDRLPGVRRIYTLTGYVPDDLLGLDHRPLGQRSIDVGYRGRDLAWWLGRLAHEKQSIAEGFLKHSGRYQLHTDIAWREADRIYGARWVEFLASCRATLGTESGASIADFDGSIERSVRLYVHDHPGSDFESVHAAVLAAYEGNVVVNVISPRVFEAAAMGTGLVMFPGTYSGIVAPELHYIPLLKDFSNMDEVVAKLSDVGYLQALTMRANDDLVRSGRWSYRRFIEEFDTIVGDTASSRSTRRPAVRFTIARAERAVRVPPARVRSLATSGSKLKAGILAVWSDAELRRALGHAVRHGMALDQTVKEILEFTLLRRAATGTLDSLEEFSVISELDSADGVLRFVSRPKDEARGRLNGRTARTRDPLRTSDVTAVEWDHSAVGESVHLLKPRMEVGIGEGGIRRFGLFAMLRLHDPLLRDRLLQPIVNGLATEPALPAGHGVRV